MKSLIAILIAAGSITTAQDQYVVTNQISDVLDEIMHVEDIAKTVEMINNQVQQINALTQQSQQIQAYVKAFGDPEQLLSNVEPNALIDSLASGLNALRDLKEDAALSGVLQVCGCRWITITSLFSFRARNGVY